MAATLCVLIAAECTEPGRVYSGQQTTPSTGRIDGPGDPNASRPANGEGARASNDDAVSAEPGRKPTFAASKVSRCRRNLNSRIQTLQHTVVLLKREMDIRQKRERDKAVTYVRDQQAVDAAARYLALVREAVTSLRNDPLARRVRVMRGDPTVGTRLLTIDRENADMMLAQAQQNYVLADRGQWIVPQSVLDRQSGEMRDYMAMELGPLTETKTLAREASKAVQAAANRPDSLDAEITKWENRVDAAVAQTYDAIEAVRAGRPSVAPARPIGFFTIAQPSQGASPLGRKRTLVIVTTLRSEFFTPHEEVYPGLLRAHPEWPPMEERQRVWVVDPNQFQVILRDGRAVPAWSLFEPEACGGDLLAKDGNRWTIRYGPDCPSRVSVRLTWLLDARDCTGPFQIRFADSEAVEVPVCRLEAGPSEPSGVAARTATQP
jgi:hypothetical protein